MLRPHMRHGQTNPIAQNRCMEQVLRSAFFLSAVLGSLWLAGCGSTAYQLNQQPTAVTPRKEYIVQAGGVAFSVTALISYDGPGSWKRHAYWDEYLVTLTNHGEAEAIAERAWLGDVLDRQVPPGDDPWRLERKGRDHESSLKSRGAPADAWYFSRSPAGKAVTGAASVGALAVIYGGAGGATLASGIVFGGPLILLAAAPVMMTNRMLLDPSRKEKIAAEFYRRKLPLPVTLGPGETVTGSLFFPLTPGPENLTLQVRSKTVSVPLRIELPGLEGLHFTYLPDKAALQAAMQAARPKRLIIPPVPRRAAPPASP